MSPKELWKPYWLGEGMWIASCLLDQHFCIQIILPNGHQLNSLRRAREVRKCEGERGRRKLP